MTVRGISTMGHPGLTQANGTPAGTQFVPEIQGLRSIALLMVVTYHIWFHRASGGVDVFLFVSAFLITRSVLHSEQKGRLRFDPIIFLAKRFARLLPLAAATVVLTVVASLAYLPPWRWPLILEEGWYTLTYRLNLLLQDRGTDYYAVDPSVMSPFQHFWSLSVQGQVFVLWAVLHFAAILLCRWTGQKLRTVLVVGFGLLFAVSLLFSIWMTAASPERAYFDTEARLWQFALGSLVATLGARHISRRIAGVMIWVGVILILTCAFVLNVGPGDFPGYKALWPLVGATLILIAVESPSRPRTPLQARWLVRAGGYTYALYLTHWPILVFFQLHLRRTELTPLQGLMVILLTAALSFLLVHTIENPAARFLAGAKRDPSTSWLAQLARPMTVVGTSVLVCSLTMVVSERAVAPTLAADPGLAAYSDWAVLDRLCADDASGCSTTSGDGAAEGGLTFIGNSHMQQFMPSLVPFAADHDLPVEAHLLPGCNYLEDGELQGRDVSCKALWEDVRSGAVAGQSDVIVIMGTVSTSEGDATPAGLEEWIHDVEASGRSVIAVRDNPRFSQNIFACGQQYGLGDAWCATPLGGSWSNPLELESPSAVVDLTESICPDLECSPAVGNQLAFLDAHHLTATFAHSMSDLVSLQLENQLTISDGR